MKEKVLSKNQLAKFVEELLKHSKVFAPVKKNGYFVFQKISAPDEMSFEFLNTKIPPKEVFYPRTEVLFSYTKNKDGIEIIEAENPDESQIILGIRACDAKGFLLLDKFFALGKFQDPYYQRRREKAILIGLACIEPPSTCFCTSLGGSPFGEEGLDVLLVDIGDKYLVKGISDKGEQMVEQAPILESASDHDISIAEDLKKKALESIITLPLENVTAQLDKLFDEDAFWEQFSNKCIGCASCTFLCPTCSCFDVTDEETPSGDGKRIRLWDTCQFPLFTKHGSGHNPRAVAMQRLRQRVMHKFSYYPKVSDAVGCVGCGRCVIVCPVNQDIRTVFKTLLAT